MAVNMGFPAGGELNQGWKLYLASLIMILSAGFVVVVRIATRFRTTKLGADDYIIMASLAFSVLLSVNIQLAVVNGYGKHKRNLSSNELRNCLKFFWIAQTPYKIVVCLNKTSVITLYRRIFISKNFHSLCYGALAIVIGSGIATTFSTIFQCIPIERSWDKTIEGRCIDSSKFWLANAVLNIFTDVVVLALPIHEIFQLQLKLQEKLMICSVFLLGGFVTITSVLRVTAVANSVHNQQDQTWTFIPRGVWTLSEANLGIICSCLPVLKQLVKRLFPSSANPKRVHRLQGTGSKWASDLNSRAERERSAYKDLQLHDLHDTINDDTQVIVGLQKDKVVGNMGRSGEWYQMQSLSSQDESMNCRKSDEDPIMVINVTDRKDSQSSKQT
ncbi:hypothetical protein BDV96DRAFT_508237 [Lophiotrema nucula]|uniref:Rhodopsin domain-containing protein n=1 Tax=Lophiotrema nucula TaxID=690887 RepID=A0A6A5YIK2_9PLEO|nr:hypothetical protein BDV96DRAFT_508237 [Lophiotrema nucula]